MVGFCLLAALMGLGLVRAWRLWPSQQDWVLIALVLLFLTQLLSRATVQGFYPTSGYCSLCWASFWGSAAELPQETDKKGDLPHDQPSTSRGTSHLRA